MLRSSLFFLLVLASFPAWALHRPALNGEFDNFTSYFFSDGKLRHHRYTLSLKEIVPLSYRLTTVVEGRGRFDAPLLDYSWAPRHDYSPAVRSDEMVEAEPRKIYLDYLDEHFRLKAGLQPIDWVESLSPYTNSFLTAYDLRHGAFGPPDQEIIPVVAADLNHKFFGGELEWLFVPLPMSDRLPVGPNGYGYYETLKRTLFPLNPVISNEPIPRTAGEMEGGVRYRYSLDPLEISGLLYYGHERLATLVLGGANGANLPIYQVYPRSLTAGVSANYGTEAAVFRLFVYSEPNAYPGSVLLDISNAQTFFRLRTGGGFDYVFSKALKLYTEFSLTHSGSQRADDYVTSIRLTNESLRDILFSLDSTFTFPKASFVVLPEVSWNFATDFTLSLGGRFIHSYDPLSDFAFLKDASQAYFQFIYHFAMR